MPVVNILPFCLIISVSLSNHQIYSFSFSQTEIIRSDEILDGHLTMKEVCRIYGLYSKVNNRFLNLNSPLPLTVELEVGTYYRKLGGSSSGLGSRVQ